MVEPKTPCELIWDPTKNPTFVYQEAIAPSFHTHEDEIIQFERWFEKLKQYQRHGDLEDSHGGHSSQMSLTDEDEFQPETLVTLVFNVRVFPSCVVFTFFFGHGIGHEFSSCPYWSNQVLPSKLVFVVPPNITPLPQSSILVLVFVVSTISVVPNIFDFITNPLNLLVPTQKVVDPNSVVPYIGTPYVVSNMYAPIVKPTLMKPRVMPPWQTIVPPYMAAYLSFALTAVHTISTPSTNFPLHNSGGLLNFSSYMGNVRWPSEPQVMTKLWRATSDLPKVHSCLIEVPIQGTRLWQGRSVLLDGGGGGPNGGPFDGHHGGPPSGHHGGPLNEPPSELFGDPLSTL